MRSEFGAFSLGSGSESGADSYGLRNALDRLPGFLAQYHGVFRSGYALAVGDLDGLRLALMERFVSVHDQR